MWSAYREVFDDHLPDPAKLHDEGPNL